MIYYRSAQKRKIKRQRRRRRRRNYGMIHTIERGKSPEKKKKKKKKERKKKETETDHPIFIQVPLIPSLNSSARDFASDGFSATMKTTLRPDIMNGGRK